MMLMCDRFSDDRSSLFPSSPRSTPPTLSKHLIPTLYNEA